MAATISPKDYAQEGVEGNVGTLEQSCGCQSYHALQQDGAKRGQTNRGASENLVAAREISI